MSGVDEDKIVEFARWSVQPNWELGENPADQEGRVDMNEAALRIVEHLALQTAYARATYKLLSSISKYLAMALGFAIVYLLLKHR